MKLSTVIMAHLKREHFVRELQAKLGDVPVVWDEQNDRWDTGRRALLAHDRDATHQCVIQDDAIVCRDLLPACEQMIETAGERPISLYAGMYRTASRPQYQRTGRAIKRAKEIAKASGAPWFPFEGPWWGVGLIIPTADIPKLVKWGDKQAIKNYDSRIGRFYIQIKKLDCWYTMPSLVDHRGPKESPSLIGNDVHSLRETGRVAHWFIGEDCSALGLDWSQPAQSRFNPDRKWATFEHRRTKHRRAVRRQGQVYSRLLGDAQWEEIG